METTTIIALQKKIDALKAKVIAGSISPAYLGILLSELLDCVISESNSSDEVLRDSIQSLINTVNSKMAESAGILLEGTKFAHNPDGVLYLRLGSANDESGYVSISCPMASASKAGFMSSSDKLKLDSLNYSTPVITEGPSSGGMSAEERAKLAELPTASALDQILAVKLNKDAGVLLEGTQFAFNGNGTIYLRLGSANNELGYVGVDCPMASQSQAGFMRNADKSKLDALPAASALNKALADKLNKDAGVLLEGTQFAFSDDGALCLRLGSANNEYGYVNVDCPMVSSTKAGFMHNADKVKLDALPSGEQLLYRLNDKADADDVDQLWDDVSSIKLREQVFMVVPFDGFTSDTTFNGEIGVKYNNAAGGFIGALDAKRGFTVYDYDLSVGNLYLYEKDLYIYDPSSRHLVKWVDRAKLDALPDALTLSANIGSKANVFAHESSATNKRAIKGDLLFALKETSTAKDVKAALTEFTTKAVLNHAELRHCAEHGSLIFDEDTQGFVQVTHNGGGFFCFTELSPTNYTTLPRLRFAALRISEDGLTFKVMRDSVCDVVVTMSDMYAVLSQFVDQMSAFDVRITALEKKDKLTINPDL